MSGLGVKENDNNSSLDITQISQYTIGQKTPYCIYMSCIVNALIFNQLMLFYIYVNVHVLC